MPMYFQFYQDCLDNKKRLNIKNAVSKLKIPHLIIHGDEDLTVNVDQARDMKKWNNNSELHIVKGSNHVFGAYHPYKNLLFNRKKLPLDLQKVVDKTISFINL